MNPDKNETDNQKEQENVDNINEKKRDINRDDNEQNIEDDIKEDYEEEEEDVPDITEIVRNSPEESQQNNNEKENSDEKKSDTENNAEQKNDQNVATNKQTAKEETEFEYAYPDTAFVIKEGDSEKYEEPKNDYPIFHQQKNTCGLSSMLMLLDPLSNPKISDLLDFVWNNVKELLLRPKVEKKEFEWCYALEYLLLKSFHENIISQYIMDHMEFADDYYINKVPLEVHLRQLMEPYYRKNATIIIELYERFFETGEVSSMILTDQIGQMKDAKELEMLMSIFGYQFLPQYSQDGTGAIFFTNKEIRKPEIPSVNRRLKLLRHEYEKGARIMIGSAYHWMAVTEIIPDSKGYILVFNDPNTARRFKIPFRKLSDTDRFYIYRKRQESAESFWEDLKVWLNEEIKKDKESFNQFNIKRQEQIKQRLKQEAEARARMQQERLSKLEMQKESEKVIINESTEKEPIKDEDLVQINLSEPDKQLITPINELKKDISPELIDLSVSSEIRSQELIPMSGDAFMDYIKKIIRSKFSDYSKL